MKKVITGVCFLSLILLLGIVYADGVKESVGVGTTDGEEKENYSVSNFNQETTKSVVGVGTEGGEIKDDLIISQSNVSINQIGEKTIIASTIGAVPADCTMYLDDCNEGNDVACYKFEFNCGGIRVESIENITISDGKLYINGQEINLSPEEALNRIGNLNLNITGVSLGEEDGTPSYEISAEREAKLFGLFNVNMPVNVQVNAQDGSVGDVEEPWWGVLTTSRKGEGVPSITIQLNQGWNLISIDKNSIVDPCSLVDGNVDAQIILNEKGSVYVPNSHFNTLSCDESIKPYDGYKINVSEDTNITIQIISGEVHQNLSSQIHDGWNLIGFENTQDSFENQLDDICSDFVISDANDNEIASSNIPEQYKAYWVYCGDINETIPLLNKSCKEVGLGCDYREACLGRLVNTIDVSSCCIGECVPATQINSCAEINQIECANSKYCSKEPIIIGNLKECCKGVCLDFPYSIEPISMQCHESIREGLCVSAYKNQFFVNNFEDSNLKIWFEYPRNVKLNEEFNFKIHIKNKKNVQQQINLEFYQSDELDFELIEGNILQNQNIILSLQEEKEIINVRFKALKKRIDGAPLSIWSEGLSDTYESIGSIVTVYSENDFVLCNNIKYPASILEEPCVRDTHGTYCYDKGFCSSNVFYPVECRNNKDCIIYDYLKNVLKMGKCNYGVCAYQNMDYNGSGQKNILIIDYSSNPTSSNICNFTDSIIANSLEEYYSLKANQYNIPLTINSVKKIANIDINDIGVDTPSNILNKTKEYFYQECGHSFDLDSFNVFVLQYLSPEDNIYPQLVDKGWISQIGCQALYPMTCKQNAGEGLNGLILAHELHHYFGCGDLYNIAGGSFQYANNIMGSGKDYYPELSFGEILTDGCDAQMGWIDLDNDGVPEILEAGL